MGVAVQPEPMASLAARVLFDLGDGSFEVFGVSVAWSGPGTPPAALLRGQYVPARCRATDPDHAVELVAELVALDGAEQ